MPRRARYRTGLLEELERQLAFAPPEALRRQMDAAERLAHEVDPGATYPFEFVVWRLTGFRPDEAAPKPIAGATLRGDLATFILHLSDRVEVAAEERTGGASTVGDLARELNVAEKTLRRWRSRGLLSHRVRFADGRSRIAIFRSEFERFAIANPDLVASATNFSRMDDATARAAVTAVQRFVGQGRTRNLAAKDAASALGRSHEAIRQLLQRTGEVVPTERSDRVRRERRFAYRAWRWGVAPEAIAERTRSKPDAVRRRIDAGRAERLRSMRLAWIDFVTFERPDAEETILAAPAVRGGLDPVFDPPEATAMLEATAVLRNGGAKAAADEDSMLAAYNLLKRRAKTRIASLGSAPDRLEIDRAETDLRWALRLKRRLVESLLPTAEARVEQVLGGPLVRSPAEEIRQLLERCVATVAEAIEGLDPSRRQSARRVVALETDRMLAQSGIGRRSRAAVRHERGSVPLAGLFDGIATWSEDIAWLDRRRARLPTLEPAARSLLARRHGWGGTYPRSLPELANEERTTIAQVTKRVADAERLLRR